ncbi:MAG: tetratricopeptide repeat protein [Planctomycetaceae bacterium]
MTHDPYAPCLCGSGKKLKFCCLEILPDMVRFQKLVDNQPVAAEKLLRSLLEKHSDKEVLVTQLAMILTNQNRVGEAREALVEYLKRHPDEPRILLSLAELCVGMDGFFASRRIVHRAFQLGARQYPDGVCALANQIARQMANFGLPIAVREHLALAARMASGERRSAVLMQLARFESQKTVPFPFRGRLALLPVALETPELQAEDLRARKVSHIGCWEPASILYGRMVEQQPNSGELWYNLGLCRAWDGRVKESAEALHKAATLLEDFDQATEAETLAQLLDQESAGEFYTVQQRTIRVRSLSELLTKLDAAPRFARVRTSGDDDESVVAEFEFLTAEPGDSVNIDNVPDVVADVTVYDAESDSEDSQPLVLLVALNDDLDSAEAAFREVVGDLAQECRDEDTGNLSRMPTEARLFDWKIHQHTALSASDIRRADQQRLKAALDKWLEKPLASLGGKSPVEAAGDESLRTKLAAAVSVLDVICNRMNYSPDLSEIRTRLKIPQPAALPVSAESSMGALPLLQLLRVDETGLTDDQVVEMTNRAALIRHSRLMDRASAELVKRPGALESFNPYQAHLMRAVVARDNNDLQLASECFEAARAAVEDQPDAFRTRLELDIRELSCRLDDPQDPGLPKLLQTIRDRYFRKIPEIEQVILEELTNSGCEHLAEHLVSDQGVAMAGSGSGSSLWTPGSESGQGSSGKLYIPGQE